MVATLLLILIAVAAAILLYAFATGLFSNLTTGGGPTALVTATGEMTVPGSTSQTGVLTLNLRNEGVQPIKNIVVSCADPPFAAATCNGFPLDYGGMLVAPGNLLPIDAFASGSVDVGAATTFTAGTTYQLIITVTFEGGSTQILSVGIPSTS